MANNTSHVDTFARDNLPPKELWPEIDPKKAGFDYGDRLNCGTELLDKMLTAGFGEKPAIYSPSETWSYKELLEKSNQIARVLVEDLGLVPGNRVLLRGPNTPMLAACWFGVIKAGGVCVTTMPLLRATELSYIIEKAKVHYALCDERCAQDLVEAQKQAPILKNIIYYKSSGEKSLESLMRLKDTAFKNVDTASDDVALIAFTSGTTGKAKATMHFHRDVMIICDSFPKSTLKPNSSDIFCGTPPFAFTFGLGALLLFPMRFGAATLLLEKASSEELLANIEKFKATICFTSPTGYRAMVEFVPKYNLTSLKKCVSAGETLPLATFETWKNVTGLKIIDGIGSTELLHIFISASGDEIRPGSTGKPIPGYEAAVFDKNGKKLPPGEIGLLGVRGPTGCRYMSDLERQKEYVRDGWNFTGDAYLMDKEGYFWFQARADDMIISGGYNISANEVENALLKNNKVKECAVVGVPDDHRGMVVKAFVVLKDSSIGGDVTRELQDFVKAEIAPYKYPRAIEFVDSLPRTETGKLQRFRLRQSKSLIYFA